MLHLQGDLQTVFDALYDLGVIEPILNVDWSGLVSEAHAANPLLKRALQVANGFIGDRGRLVQELGQLDPRSLELLAMEVAREFAGFHSQKSLHS